MKNIKKIVFLICLFIFISACLKANLKPLKIQTQNGSVVYYVEVVSSQKDLQKGLMFRDYLKSDRGMLFLFDNTHPQPVTMWMKNTYIPLDMLFLNQDNIIVAIYENAKPLSLKIITPKTKEIVRAVIELNAGDVKKNNIRIGDKIMY